MENILEWIELKLELMYERKDSQALVAKCVITVVLTYNQVDL